ncbi:hypothetical protein DW1_0806 [Proteiniborus sp. DW1]|uniref:hypothetical protein n=1 Tax=Proteiniborus sp. DW1 TaxID=1889883 RepID=UPI00092E1778|nr:hypothetical protein [Proteiniborus sp. DW1]SCG82414.1 hypothetical protein DW1_0806 [Proteiniborus sp. DW1]
MWSLIIIVFLLIWLNLHLFRVYFRFIFNNEDDFHSSLKYTLTPDIFSLFRGEYCKDKFAEFKFGVFIFLCVVTIVLEIMLVNGVVNLI